MNIIGRTEESTRVNGSTTKCRDADYSLGLTDVSTKANTEMIRKKDPVCSFGLTVANTKVCGRTVVSTAKDFTTMEKDHSRRKVFGWKASAQSGYEFYFVR